jgi:osmotically-inducible protein OsmY
MLVVEAHRLSPSAVRFAVEHALEREAALAVARHIEIVTAAGRVILSGAIPRWAEVEPILEAVRQIPGVVEIENRLEKEH